MKKNYISPVVEVNAFDFEDVVMTSGDVNPNNSVAAGNTGAINNFKAAAENAGAIVVEW